MTEISEETTPTVAPVFSWRSTAIGPALQSHALTPLARHLFTSRAVSFRGADERNDSARLAACFGVAPEQLVLVKQVHGRTAVLVRPADSPADLIEADAVVCTDPGRLIAVRVADCVPLLIADSDHRVVAAVHAGWRGTCAGVVASAIETIAGIGVAAADLSVAIGPSIGPCCYQVDERVRNTFLGSTPEAVSWFEDDGPGHWRLDLWQANVDQLVAAGVPRSAVHVAGYCTAEHLDRCFSYRAEGPGTGRMVAAIQLGAPRT